MRTVQGSYILAALITAVIFGAGMLLGMLIESRRVDLMSSLGREQRLELASLQLQYQFISELGEERNCDALAKAFESHMIELAKAQERLESYTKNTKLERARFNDIKREYTQAQLATWLLAKKVRSTCGFDIISVLYFYAPECAACEDQAFVLSYLKTLLKEKLLVFSLDSALETEPMIEMLRKSYRVTDYPSLVIEGKLLVGLRDKAALAAELCPNYAQPNELCS